MRVCVIGCRWFLDDIGNISEIPLDVLFKYSGNNSGNLFIGEAVRSHIRRMFPDAYIEHYNFDKIRQTEGQEVKDRFDYIVMAASNMLNPSTAFGFICNFVEGSGIPLIILGIGAQAESNKDMYQINPGTLRLMRYAAESAKNGIGVRGAFTAELLNQHGISNIRVIGCPTFYKNSGRNFRVSKAPAAHDIVRAAVSFKRDRNKYQSDHALKRVQSRIFDLALSRDFYCIEQAHYAEAWMSHSNSIDLKKIDGIQQYFCVSEDKRERLIEYVRERVRIFFDYRSWKNLIDSCDYAFGARFHGNMMAMTSGVPALWITHDSRTSELCDTLGLPSLSIHEIDEKGFDLQELVDRTNYDNFNATYQSKCDIFDEFFSGQLS